MSEHCMKLSSRAFELTQGGSKDIEIRFWDEKRQQIKVGDVLIFTHIVTDEKFHRRVKELHIYELFENLFRSFPPERFGWDNTDRLVFNRYDPSIDYTPERESRYGVVGIVHE